jgi:hypothetical protein
MELEPQIIRPTLSTWNLPYYDIHCHMWNEINTIHNIVMQKNLHIHRFNWNKTILQL